MAADKYLADVTGQITEKQATDTSAGAGDAGKIVALNASGQIDATMSPVNVGHIRAFAARH